MGGADIGRGGEDEGGGWWLIVVREADFSTCGIFITDWLDVVEAECFSV